MNELIKITENNGKKVVSAKELQNFLDSKTDFSSWCKRLYPNFWEKFWRSSFYG